MEIGSGSGLPATDAPARATPRAAQIAIRTRIRHILLIVTTLNGCDILGSVKIGLAVYTLHYRVSVYFQVFFALKAGIGDNAMHPSGPTIFFQSGKAIITTSNLLLNGCMA